MYRSKDFLAELQKQQQSIEFYGVRAHHLGDIAERAIQTISDSAKTRLILTSIKWPEVVEISLWPMPIDYAIFLYSRMCSMQKIRDSFQQ